MEAEAKKSRRSPTAKPGTKLGRKPKMQDGKPVRLYMGEQTIEEARRIGDGNVSEGVRRAVEAWSRSK